MFPTILKSIGSVVKLFSQPFLRTLAVIFWTILNVTCYQGLNLSSFGLFTSTCTQFLIIGLSKHWKWAISWFEKLGISNFADILYFEFYHDD